MNLENVDLPDFLVKTLVPQHSSNQRRFDRIDAWSGDQRPGIAKPKLPRQATAEYQTLSDLSATPWGDLIVSSLVQMLYVEGYRRADGQTLPGWDAWQRNGMDARQIPLHFDAVKYGLSYATVLPSAGDPKVASIRPKSPKRLTAFYDDVVDDEWPTVALELRPLPTGGFECKVYDEQFVWSTRLDASGRVVDAISAVRHGLGYCPVVRFTNRFDLVGNALGEVEPFITLFHRIDQTIFDRLIVQRFASWVTRTVSGMAPPDGVPQENIELTQEQQDILQAAKLQLSADSALISDDPETKFGSLPASPLDPFVSAKDSDVRDLSAVAQVPRHTLLGIEANMGSEALASAEKGQSRKKVQRQHTLGESHEQMLAAAERIEGATNDPAAQVFWFDTEPAALPSTADALAKLKDIGLPMRAVLQRVPGATQADVDAWMKELDQASAEGGISDEDMKVKLDAMGAAIRAGATFESAAKLLGIRLQFTGDLPVTTRDAGGNVVPGTVPGSSA